MSSSGPVCDHGSGIDIRDDNFENDMLSHVEERVGIPPLESSKSRFSMVSSSLTVVFFASLKEGLVSW